MGSLQFIMKVNNYCNLNCSYCYQSYDAYKAKKGRGKVFDIELFNECVEAAFQNTSENFGESLFQPRLNFVIQGGEPLLAGKSRMDTYLEIITNLSLKYGFPTHKNVHTNGVLLDKEWCSIFKKWDCSVTVSVDGMAETHDAQRVDHMHRPTHSKVMSGIRLAQKEGIDVSAMCVIPSKSCGGEVQRFFENAGIKNIGYLLPAYERTSSYLPSREESSSYGEFLISAFDEWLDSPRDDVRVQFFDAAIRAIAGKPSGLAGVGGFPARWTVFRPDGSVEAGDPYGLYSYGCVKGKNPLDSIREAEENEFYRLQASGGFLPTKGDCNRCDLAHICQGGFLVHRFDKVHGFDSPSSYCGDLYRFYHHVLNRLRQISVYENLAS